MTGTVARGASLEATPAGGVSVASAAQPWAEFPRLMANAVAAMR